VPHLALLNQILHRSRHIFDRHVGINAVLIEEVNVIRPEALERSLGNGLDLLRLAVQADDLAALNLETKLARDQNLMTHWCQGFADQFFIGMRSIGFSRIKERDAAVHTGANCVDAILLAGCRAQAKAQPHAAHTEGRYFQLAQFAFLHILTPFHS